MTTKLRYIHLLLIAFLLGILQIHGQPRQAKLIKFYGNYYNDTISIFIDSTLIKKKLVLNDRSSQQTIMITIPKQNHTITVYDHFLDKKYTSTIKNKTFIQIHKLRSGRIKISYHDVEEDISEY